MKSIDQLLATAEKRSLHRSLGPTQITLLGVGAIVGTGIFVLTAAAAQKAGPGMMVSFVISGAVCTLAALCYAEMSTMVPVSGSAYTYSYAVLGEHVAWVVGWALILQYTLSASAVSVGWAGYVSSLLNSVGIGPIPLTLTKSPAEGGSVNLLATLIALFVTGLLVVGTRASAVFNASLVVVKLSALVAFLILSLPAMNVAHFEPFAPAGWSGIGSGAATIFFAFLGFDAVATAAEETKNPQRNLPIGIIGSLAICTVLYLLVAAAVVGAVGAQPLRGADGVILAPGGGEFARVCHSLQSPRLVCSAEPIAFAAREIGRPEVANFLRLAVGFALPSAVLLMIFAQTRILFVMSRDGLLPQVFSRVHPRYRTPHVITIVTGVFVVLLAGFAPLARLTDLANAGTLFAFLMVATAVMVQRVRAPQVNRPFRLPFVWIVAPSAAAGCVYLIWNLGAWIKLVFIVWTLAGIALYLAYGFRKSHLAGIALRVARTR